MTISSKLFRYWLPVLLWMGVIFYLSSIPSLESGFTPATDRFLRKCAHAGEYALLCWQLFRALTKGHGIAMRKALIAATFIGLLYAASDEYHQTFVHGREGRARDVAIDAIGIAAATSLLYMVNKARSKPFA